MKDIKTIEEKYRVIADDLVKLNDRVWLYNGIKHELIKAHALGVKEERERIIEMLYFVLGELTAIDQALRLEPTTIYNPFKLREAENVAIRTTLEKFKIPFTEEDLRPEGNKQKQAIIDFLKNR